jgi:TIR domain
VARAAASVKYKEIDSILQWVPRCKSAPRRNARQSSRTAIDAFISYSSPDRQTALIICQELESRGLACWIAPRDVGAGVSYPEAIMQGLRAAKVLVLVFSTHANASPHVEREVERAVSLRTPVLTLRLTDIAPADSLEYLISTTQWQEAENPPQAKDLERLAEAVNRLVSG